MKWGIETIPAPPSVEQLKQHIIFFSSIFFSGIFSGYLNGFFIVSGKSRYIARLYMTVIIGIQMNRHEAMRKSAFEFTFYHIAHGMCLKKRNFRIEYEMKLDKSIFTGTSGFEKMIRLDILRSCFYDIGNFLYIGGAQSLVHKYLIRGSYNLTCSIDDVRRYEKGNNHIDNIPSGKFYNDDGDDNPDIGKKIRFIMKRIRFYNEIVGFSGNSIQVPYYSDGKCDGYDHEDNRNISIYNKIFAYEFSNRKKRDKKSRDDDDKSLYKCRDSLYLPISIMIDIVIALLGFLDGEEINNGDKEIQKGVYGT